MGSLLDAYCTGDAKFNVLFGLDLGTTVVKRSGLVNELKRCMDSLLETCRTLGFGEPCMLLSPVPGSRLPAFGMI